MKKLLIVAAIAVAGATGAQAADVAAPTYAKAPVYAAPAYNWTGFYVGAHLGGAFRGNDNYFLAVLPGAVTSGDDSYFLGGGQVGADYQFAPNWLIGVEGQYSGLSSSVRTYTGPIAGNFISTKPDWIASVTGRLGFTWGPGLIYAKGGVAFRDDGNIIVSTGGPTTFTTTHDNRGYTVGGGFEYMFAPSWSAKVEYQYYDFGSTNVSTPAGLFSVGGGNFRENLHTVKAGINYHFNWGGPVVAKY